MTLRNRSGSQTCRDRVAKGRDGRDVALMTVDIGNPWSEHCRLRPNVVMVVSFGLQSGVGHGRSASGASIPAWSREDRKEFVENVLSDRSY